MKPVFYLVFSFLLASSRPCVARELSIDRKQGAEKLVMPMAMQTALTKWNPKFKHWETRDYSKKIRDGLAETKETRAAFALILDVNGDKITDLILDGRDDSRSFLIGVISMQSGYSVQIIREYSLVDPRELENWNDGVKDMGLNYFLTPAGNKTIFTIAYPQQSDAEGKLLNDGSLSEYSFENGKFHENYEPL